MRNEPGLARRIKYFVAAQPRWLSMVIVFLAAIPVIVIVIDTPTGTTTARIWSASWVTA